MRFLVDAQLPWRLAAFLVDQGHDAIHTRSLPDGNRMTDGAIADLGKVCIEQREVPILSDLRCTATTWVLLAVQVRPTVRHGSVCALFVDLCRGTVRGTR